MFVTRLLTVAIALPLFLTALFFLPQQLWALVLLPLLAMASWEWAGLAAYSYSVRVAYSAVLVVSAVGVFAAERLAKSQLSLDLTVYGVSLVFWLAIAPFWLGARWRTRNPLLLGLAGWIALVPTWVALVQLQPQPWVLLLLLFIVWVSDTAAYLAGQRWGRHKLAPLISPGKTWEGAIGAASAVAVYYVLLLVFVPHDEPHFSGWIGLGVFAAVFTLSIEGDLFESWIKRRAGVKDSGQVLPGHGGILDRIDGLTASMPAAAIAFELYFK